MLGRLMRSKILIGVTTLMTAIPVAADWCHVMLGERYQRAIDLPRYHTQIESEYVRAINLYIRERADGSMSIKFRDEELPVRRARLVERFKAYQPDLPRYAREQLAKLDRLRLFSPDIERAFENLAKKKHKPALRCLGHIYEYGIGVDIDLASAWAFYDTYNLVAGSDGRDSYRDRVSKNMTEMQILAGQGLARTFKDLYTDAWKMPSMTIIQ